jgi:transcription elongation factor S-II
MSTESSTQIIIKSMEVEKAAFVAFKGETAEYRSKLRSLFQNLKNKSNRELGPRVLSGEIPADRFVVMTHEELKSAEQRKVDDKLEAENMKKAQVPMAQKSISDALQCGRCKQKKVSYSQAQTRSADEPMTTFCECTVCGNRWKVNPLLILHTSTLLIEPPSSLEPFSTMFLCSSTQPLLLLTALMQLSFGRVLHDMGALTK